MANKNRIPEITACVLALGGCSDGASPGSVANAICGQIQRCDSDGFDMEFESADDCVDYYTGIFTLIQAAAAECFDAYAAYYNCYSSLTCEEAEEDEPERCASLAEQAEEACAGSDLPGDDDE